MTDVYDESRRAIALSHEPAPPYRCPDGAYRRAMAETERRGWAWWPAPVPSIVALHEAVERAIRDRIAALAAERDRVAAEANEIRGRAIRDRIAALAAERDRVAAEADEIRGRARVAATREAVLAVIDGERRAAGLPSLVDLDAAWFRLGAELRELRDTLPWADHAHGEGVNTAAAMLRVRALS